MSAPSWIAALNEYDSQVRPLVDCNDSTVQLAFRAGFESRDEEVLRYRTALEKIVATWEAEGDGEYSVRIAREALSSQKG